MDPLNWSILTPYAIAMPTNVHYSGRVADVLTYKNAIVVGTAFGGVWIVNKDATIADAYATTSLADLPDPNVSCLANGPDGEAQVYVGCANTLYFMRLDVGEHGPEASLVRAIPFPAAPETFNRIVVQKGPRRIVVATGGEGVWWSPIPDQPRDVDAYHWQQATGLPGKRVGGLCTRAGDNVHAAMWSQGNASDATFGIFKGTFQGGALTFTRSRLAWVDGGSDFEMVRISLASCASRPDVAFAVCSKAERMFRGVLQYDPSADVWIDTRAETLLSDDPGTQGEFNNCITIASDDAELVAFGWQKGTFVRVKRDGRHAWKKLDSPAAHGDIHGVLFVALGSGEHTLYVGGDGGVLEVTHPKDKTPEFSSRLNILLPTLLFRDRLRTSFATTDVSGAADGLIAGGLQDNGVKYLKTSPTAYGQWQHLYGGDGSTCEFLTNGVLVTRESNKDHPFRGSVWNANANMFEPSFAIPIDVSIDDEDKPRMWLCSRVIDPTFRNASHQLMHAMSAAVRFDRHQKPTHDVILGLFADEAFANPHWQVIGKPGTHVTALASMNGATVLVGLDDGTLVMLNTATGMQSPVGLPVSGGSIVQFEVVSASLVFALYAGATGSLLVLDGLTWKTIPLEVSEPVFSFAVDWDRRTVFIATEAKVYRGVQKPPPAGPGPVGFQTAFWWTNESAGLPALPHNTHLRIGLDIGARYLYLSTYGRSVYRAQLAPAPPQPPGR